MSDWPAFVVALAAFVTAASGFLKVWYDIREVHKTLNSRLNQLLAASSKVSRAEGVEEGRKEGKESPRSKPCSPNTP